MKKLRHFCVVIAIFCFCVVTSIAQEQHWMPDPNLRRVVSEWLDVETLTIADMQRLYDLVSVEDNIQSLKGLEHAVHLEFLHIGRCRISDLTPIANLHNLRVLKLHSNQISSLASIANLTQLRELQLQNNQISDLTPLSNLIALESLDLHGNQIVDFTPLLNLTNLVFLDVRDNLHSGAGQFISADPAIIDALRVRICEFERPTYMRPVKERIAGRDYPSVFSPHVSIVNTTDLEPLKHLARADLSFGPASFYPLGALKFAESPLGGIERIGRVDALKQHHADLLRENPNMLFLVELRYYSGIDFGFTEDSPYWLRNSDGTIAQRIYYRDAQGNEYRERLLDFTNPEVQKIIIAQAVAVAKCGLYDGIWLDRWHENHNDLSGYISLETELTARDQILQGIRQAVPSDFLILVNANWAKIPRWASYINGIFMETVAPPDPGSLEFQGENYTHQDFHEFEEALIWNQANLREPNFTLLLGRLPTYTDPQSPKIRRTMRAFTTLSLTHSDGYVMMEQHNSGGVWYDFWSANLGEPIGEKVQLYQNHRGLFIREFTNGWAVYNRSGKTHNIQFPERVSGVASGRQEKYWHELPDLDGEIYLKHITPQRGIESVDINSDGIVNILDVVAVANAFGEAAPDLNGDGIVNVLDLVRVAGEMR